MWHQMKSLTEFEMSEVIKAEWFDLADNERDDIWTWMHTKYLPALQASQGVSWVGHYDIVALPKRPLHRRSAE